MEPYQSKLTIFKDSDEKRKVKYEVLPSSPVEIVGSLCDDKLTKDTVERLNRFIGFSARVIDKNTALCEREDLQLLGRHLYHILLGGIATIGNAETDKTLGELFIKNYDNFEKDLKGSSDHDQRFRVKLIFEEGMDELAGYPWEFLYIPRPSDTGFFLAGQKAELILTRFVEKLGTPNKVTTDEKLVILIAWAQPKELGPVDESDTVIAINKLADDIQTKLTDKNIEVIQLADATHEKLKSKIDTLKPHIVHFIGHGQVKDGKSKIALMKIQKQIDLEKAKIESEGRRGDPEQAAWTDSSSIRALFSDNPPRLVFLHACNSFRAPKSLEIFKSTAEQVLRADVPFVVAMQYEISNEDATFFAQTFYKKLGEGMSIDEAVKSGRNELGRKAPSWGHPRFGTPVVYLQSEDSVIVKKEVKESDEAKDRLATTKHDCPYPNCPNIVSPDQKRCDCQQRVSLKQCPKCGKAILLDIGECKYCEYIFDADPEIPGTATLQFQRDRGPGPEGGPQQ